MAQTRRSVTPQPSIDELRGLQLERLRETLERVYERVPHYRQAFDAAGVRPADLGSLDDLGRFPFTGKEDLRANYPFGMFAVPREEVVRIHASSGTTGRPTVVGYTQRDVDTWAELVARSLESAGVRRGDVVHIAYGYGLFTGGLGSHYGAERLGCTVVPVSGGMTERQVQLIADFEPRVIMVTPSYFLAIVDEMERAGLDPAASSIEIGIFGAEPWSQEMRAEIEQRCGMHAVDLYGLSEVIGPGVARESVETKDGLHVWEDHFYPEIVDPETGRALPDGELGELVFTSLTKEAMPIVRYRTRDLTRLAARHGARAPPPDGAGGGPHRRHDDRARRQRLPEPDRGADPPRGGAGPALPLRPHPPGRLDVLTVRVEAVDTFAAGDAASRLAGELVERVKHTVGVTVDVDVVAPGALERSQGKAKRIDDRR